MQSLTIKITIFLSVGLLVGILFTASTHSPLHAAAAPTVNSVTTTSSSGGSETSSFTLIENSTTTVFVHGTITDPDGCADVATNGSVTGKFYRSNHSFGDGCSADNNDCYVFTNAICTKTNCDGTPEDTTFNYECSIPIQYYADTTTTGPHSASDWTAKIIATDAATASGSATDAIEMNSTVALDVTPSINYGTNDLGSESGEQSLVVTNTGNTAIDIDLSVNGSMNCSSGQITPDRVHYSRDSSFAYSQKPALSTTPTELELDLANRSDDAAPSTKNAYFKLVTPSTGVGGSCSNTLTVSAKADAENGW